jgi:flavoprotein
MNDNKTDKCKLCGQSRPYKGVFIRNNIASFALFKAQQCQECGRLPADNSAISGKKVKDNER